MTLLTRASVDPGDPGYISPLRQQHCFITLDGKEVAEVVLADSIEGFVEVLDRSEEARLLNRDRVATVTHRGIVLIYCHKPRWMA